MCSALGYLIEGYQHTSYLFMIRFNPSNIYALLYVAPSYGNCYICPNVGNWVGAILRILVFVSFIIVHYYLLPYFIIVRFFIIIFILVILSISSCLHLLIYYQSSMKRVFNIMLYPNTSWTGVACSVGW